MIENKLILGDCLSVMDDIDDQSIDLILCDLPYGTTKCKWDEIIPFQTLWTHYNRVIKSNGPIVLFSSQPFTSKLVCSNIEDFKYCWTWDKVKPNGHLVAKIRPMQRTEDICVFGKGKIPYYPIMVDRETPKKSKEYGRTEIMGGTQTDVIGKTLTQKYPQSVLVYSNASQKNKIHPTQKPVELCEYLISTYSMEGDIILDNCAGSGSTLVAAKNLNRKYIGIEMDEEYYNKALERLI